MKVLCVYSDCGPSFVRRGWGNVFSALGHEFVFWRPQVKPAFDIFTEYEPDVFLGTTYGLDRALYKCIVRRPHLKIALFASAWGKLADQIPEDYPITRARHDEKVTITTLKATCGQPEIVFSHVTDTYLDALLGGWKETGVHIAGILNAADTFVYLGGKKRVELQSDACIIGGRWEYKARNLDRYILPLCHPSSGLNVKIWGNQQWPVAQYLGIIDEEDVKDAFASTSVCMNVSEPHSTDFGYDCVERPFKCLAAGGFVVSDYVDEMQTLVFQHGEVPAAKTPEEYQALVRHFVAHPEESVPYVRLGRYTVLKYHTYFHRVEQILRGLTLDQEADKCMRLYKQLVEPHLENGTIPSGT